MPLVSFVTGLFGNEREPEEEGQGTLTFVYVWTLILTAGMTIYGNRMMAQGNLETLRFTLLSFANYAFICCVLVGGLGVIEIEGREIEETGWYGQTSVLFFLTCALGLLSSLIFATWLRKRIKDQAVMEDNNQHGFVSMENTEASQQNAQPQVQLTQPTGGAAV
jgi:CDP-diglyceride synthetase